VSDDARALLITGAVGAGKTTVARAAAELLYDRGVPGAVIDLDAIAESWPRPAGDPFGVGLMLANLRAMWQNFRVAGARRLILAGVIESVDDRTAHESALGGVPLVVCRLVAPVPTLQQRVRERETDASRDWHVARAAELTDILDAARVEDFAVDGNAGSPLEVARVVLTEWLTIGSPT